MFEGVTFLLFEDEAEARFLLSKVEKSSKKIIALSMAGKIQFPCNDNRVMFKTTSDFISIAEHKDILLSSVTLSRELLSCDAILSHKNLQYQEISLKQGYLYPFELDVTYVLFVLAVGRQAVITFDVKKIIVAKKNNATKKTLDFATILTEVLPQEKNIQLEIFPWKPPIEEGDKKNIRTLLPKSLRRSLWFDINYILSGQWLKAWATPFYISQWLQLKFFGQQFFSTDKKPITLLWDRFCLELLTVDTFKLFKKSGRKFAFIQDLSLGKNSPADAKPSAQPMSSPKTLIFSGFDVNPVLVKTLENLVKTSFNSAKSWIEKGFLYGQQPNVDSVFNSASSESSLIWFHQGLLRTNSNIQTMHFSHGLSVPPFDQLATFSLATPFYVGEKYCFSPSKLFSKFLLQTGQFKGQEMIDLGLPGHFIGKKNSFSKFLLSRMLFRKLTFSGKRIVCIGFEEDATFMRANRAYYFTTFVESEQWLCDVMEELLKDPNHLILIKAKAKSKSPVINNLLKQHKGRIYYFDFTLPIEVALMIADVYIALVSSTIIQAAASKVPVILYNPFNREFYFEHILQEVSNPLSLVIKSVKEKSKLLTAVNAATSEKMFTDTNKFNDMLNCYIRQVSVTEICKKLATCFANK